MEYDWLGFGYAALVAAGGVVGYAKAGSVPSLAAGLLFGGLAGLGAYQQSKDPKNVWLSLACFSCPVPLYLYKCCKWWQDPLPTARRYLCKTIIPGSKTWIVLCESRVGEKYLSPLPD